VQPVAHGTAEKVVVTRSKSRGDESRVGDGADGIGAVDLGRKHAAGRIGIDLVIGDEKDKAQLRGDVATEVNPVRPRSGKSAEGSGSGIVRVPLEIGADPVESAAIQRTPVDFVESVQDAESHRHAAAQTARTGDIAFDRPCEIKSLSS